MKRKGIRGKSLKILYVKTTKIENSMEERKNSKEKMKNIKEEKIRDKNNSYKI